MKSLGELATLLVRQSMTTTSFVVRRIDSESEGAVGDDLGAAVGKERSALVTATRGEKSQRPI